VYPPVLEDTCIGCSCVRLRGTPASSGGAARVSKTAARRYPEQLPVGYYLDNFQKILDFVDSRYGDILTKAEKGFSRSFRSLSLGPRRLYVRLISRKGPLFRSDTLRYAEIGDIEEAAGQLVENGFLEQDGVWELSEELALLRKPEILELIGHCRREAGGGLPDSAAGALPKNRLLEIALSLPNHPEIRRYLRRSFRLYRPRKEREILVYRLLFFGNLHQDLTEFVVTDLGHVRYESYAIRRKDRLFDSRAILEHTLQLIELTDAFHGAVQGRAVQGRTAQGRAAQTDSGALLPLLERLPERSAAGEDPALGRMRDDLICGIARQLERTGDDSQALHLYSLAERPPARERRARILARTGAVEQALELCRRMQEDPWEETEQEFAGRFARRLQLAAALPVAAAERPALELELKLAWVPKETVEQAVLRHYRRRGFAGYHTENVLWTGLFGLAFWDIVFLSLPGTFFNRYQRGPRDLFRPEFRRRRERLIRERLGRIRSAPSWPRELLRVYDRKEGIANDLVHWKLLPRELVERSVRTIPRAHLAAVFDRLSRDPGTHKSGFPDLVLFAPARHSVSYQLVEVKGPGDQLQTNQRRWLRYFASHGIPCTLVRVRRSVENG
jgi:hypothetical protein